MKINSNLAVNNSGFIFNPSNGDSFSANAVGAEIISLMKEGKTPKEITDHLCNKYDVDEKTAERDLEDFTAFLHDNFLASHD